LKTFNAAAPPLEDQNYKETCSWRCDAGFFLKTRPGSFNMPAYYVVQKSRVLPQHFIPGTTVQTMFLSQVEKTPLSQTFNPPENQVIIPTFRPVRAGLPYPGCSFPT